MQLSLNHIRNHHDYKSQHCGQCCSTCVLFQAAIRELIPRLRSVEVNIIPSLCLVDITPCKDTNEFVLVYHWQLVKVVVEHTLAPFR